jgi:hypothetical protein
MPSSIPSPPQRVPSETGVLWQPRFVSQLSAVHGSRSSHVGKPSPPRQVPSTHWSPSEQAFPSLHAVPFVTFVVVHAPVVVLQTERRHGSDETQRGPPPTHVPASQRSPTVQTLPSSHEVPLSGVFTHPVAISQRSEVHGLRSLHPDGTHRPPQHIWPVAHTRSSRMQVSPEQCAVWQGFSATHVTPTTHVG